MPFRVRVSPVPLAATLAIASALTASPAEGGDIRVSVTVLTPEKKTVPGAGSVVWVVDPEAAKSAAASAKPQIASKGKRFEPHVTAVPIGGTVQFPNLDGIYHNAFSLSEIARFDLGLYRNGASRAMSFERPGVVRIYCNIHPQMAALLVVMDGAIWAQAQADGTAVLANVPEGKATVKAWDERGGEFKAVVDVPASGSIPLAIALDGSSWHEAAHKNKYGKEYPPPDDDANRY
jgi:plastocyanin